MAVTTPVGSVVDRHSISVASEVISSASESNTLSLKGSNRRKKGASGVYKSTAQSDSPSHIASIPSKYQTFFVASNEHQGFNSTSRRFGSSLTSELADDNPGPGTYTDSDTTTTGKKTESFSKKGTGGLASKTRRFPRHTRGGHALGPGSYDPVLFPPRLDFNRAEYSSNFHCPIAIKKSSDQNTGLPAPNAYTINTPTSSGANGPSVPFKSTSKRAQLINSNNPGPGQYNPKHSVLHPSVCTQKANFLSKTNRKGQLDTIPDNPGPADYHNDTQTDTNSSNKPNYRHKHYLCISAPAIPLPPMPALPGPGHYEVSPQGDNPQLVSGAVFKSTSSRWSRPMYNEAPGPGAYDPRSIGKQSFLYNISHGWV